MRLIMKLVMEEKTDRLVINGNVQVKIRAAKKVSLLNLRKRI